MTQLPITVWVPGIPKGQPRPRAFARNGMVRMYDPHTAEGWKSCIADAWRQNAPVQSTLNGPVSLVLHFLMPRPKAHFGKAGLKENAPHWFTSRPDLDNLEKACLDAMTQLRVWEDDSQVVQLQSSKVYVDEDSGSGCLISVKETDECLHTQETDADRNRNYSLPSA